MKLVLFVGELKSQTHTLKETNRKSFVSMHLLEKCFPQCRKIPSIITYLKKSIIFEMKEAWAVNKRNKKVGVS